jgi:glyoxylase-like metal-dependent hydrolase (beta-lactamase superfamily II)
MNHAQRSDWYARRRSGDGVTLIWETPLKPFYRCNIWHVRGRDRDLLIDTGMGLRPLAPTIAAISERPVLALASHAHVDHIGGHHEFADRAVHEAEAATLAAPNRHNTIAEPYLTDTMFEDEPLAGFDVATYCVRAAPATRTVTEGDVIDLGDRAFEVLHVPGHSPGSIALWEEASGILFSGDTVYDGPLIDDFHHSVVGDYLASMERLRRMPVRVVHAGHFDSFGRERFRALIDEYVVGKRAAGCPTPRTADRPA